MTTPPSREPGQADAALEADIAAFLREMEHWNKPPRDAALTVRILADRARDKERIGELEEELREQRNRLHHASDYLDHDERSAIDHLYAASLRHAAGEIDALLVQEVPDGE